MKKTVSIVCMMTLLFTCLFSCSAPNPQINEPEEIYGLQIGMRYEEWIEQRSEDDFDFMGYNLFEGVQNDIVIVKTSPYSIDLTDPNNPISKGNEVLKIWSCEKPPERSKAYLKKYVHEGMTFAELVAIAGMPVGESGSGVSIIAFPLKGGGALQTWWCPSEDGVSDCLQQFKFS
ncbi:MAG: hypothetical protein IJ012_07000 [Clostridia bacterium]|nr:hypothetical protein [Clostridia bacterium]